MKRSDLESLGLEQLRAHRGEKWQRYPADVLPAWVAELDFPVAKPIQAVIETALQNHDFGYPLDAVKTGLPEAFCERMERRFRWSPDPGLVEVLSDVVQGVYIAIDTLSEPGDAVAIHTPIYPPFLWSLRDTGRRLASNPLVDSGTRYELDLAGLRAAPVETRILLLCNPHNPTGRVFSRAELESLAGLAAERDWWIVSDEIHADLVYPGAEHVPIASLGPEVAARTLTLTSATKAFNIPGLRCAVAAVGSAALRERFDRLPHHERGGLGSLGIAATIAAWREGDAWLETVRDYLRDNRDALVGAVEREFPGVIYRPPEAGYLAWLDCRALDLDGSASAYQFFLDRARVALSPGEVFGEPGRGFVRLNFGTTEAMLGEILRRMRKAIEGGLA